MSTDRFRINFKKYGLLFLVLLTAVLSAGCKKQEEQTPVINIEEEETTDAVSENETEASAVLEIINPVAADVAEMDDVNDPQAEETTDGENDGAKVEITALKNEFETSGVTLGIDVAKWQGTIDWQQVAATGIEFAIIRVGYRAEATGVIYEDPCAKYNLQQAQAAGLKLGVYFYSTAVTEEEAAEEAAWVTSFIAQYPITYPVAYNCENFKAETSRQYSLTKEERSS
ncbi:MAG TPA: GH25 family lysozyme, partial [Lachnospiraceae bacterium]|nr:GH25 family lysozyme [Lachnospiraceae bacterium]